MDQDDSYRIEAEAARELAKWKAFFAEQVAVKAKELAAKGDTDVVTLDHYRQAASAAAQLLATAVQNIEPSDGSRKAA